MENYKKKQQALTRFASMILALAVWFTAVAVLPAAEAQAASGNKRKAS